MKCIVHTIPHVSMIYISSINCFHFSSHCCYSQSKHSNIWTKIWIKKKILIIEFVGHTLYYILSHREINQICLFNENFAYIVTLNKFKGTQEWEFFWLRFWILYYFIVSYVKILRFCKNNFLIGPVLEEVRFFRVVLGLHGMKKKILS